ncbi:alpha/beta fold hydrolase [Nonomuraea sp. NPDC050643]|uniref:thioesterase II family protein n=1 Tax=Nonomuraea sp. NPDC050643 TaxID=3155660 RepID=UPI0033F04332
MSEEHLWIRRFRPCPDDAPRLICFPHAGGAASHYFTLSRQLEPRIEVLAVQYPGRHDRRREPCVTTIAELTEHVHTAIGGLTDRPFAFFGHSMGAVIAYEVARRLQDRGEPLPLRLFASGRRAPSTHRTDLLHLRDDAGLIADMVAAGGTDPRLLRDEELLADIVRVARNDYRAIETYSWTPGPPLRCPITALTGDADPKTTLDEASAWGRHCTQGFDLITFSGGHFYLDTAWANIAEIVSAGLGAACRTDQLKGRAT